MLTMLIARQYNNSNGCNWFTIDIGLKELYNQWRVEMCCRMFDEDGETCWSDGRFWRTVAMLTVSAARPVSEDTSLICHPASPPTITPHRHDITLYQQPGPVTRLDQVVLAAKTDGKCQRIFFSLQTIPPGLRLITKFSPETNFLKPPDKLSNFPNIVFIFINDGKLRAN